MIAPWNEYFKKVEALFKHDPQVTVKYDEAAREISLYVDDPVKADALAKILPEEKTFGNVVITTKVIPANNNEETVDDLIAKAFKGNRALNYVKTIPTPFGNMTFAVFNPDVVQYYNDDIGDINGLCSTLYQDIAKDVLNADKVHFCTNKIGNEPWLF